jgi:hypothetical protein
MSNVLSYSGCMEFGKYFTKIYWNPARKVFAVWAIIILMGFIATHFYQDPTVNWVWTVLSVIGLWVMYKHMPLRIPKLKKIFLGWVGVIVFGMVFSFAIFSFESLYFLIGYLGIFWLLLMGIGHWLNGWFDRSKIYIYSGLVQVVAGVACYFFLPLLLNQYIVAGVVGAVAMVMLLLFRYK